MIIHSDWHIHSEASYDATLTLDEIAAAAKRCGFVKFGITDHANFNDESFWETFATPPGVCRRSKRHIPKWSWAWS